MGLHIGIKDDDDIIVLRRLLREDEELERGVDVARLAVDGHARPFVARQVDEPLVPH